MHEEAAELLAVIKRDMKAKYEGRLVVPPKQISERKARAMKPVPAALQPIVDNPPLPHTPAVATAIPIQWPICNTPFAAISPFPMLPFGSPSF